MKSNLVGCVCFSMVALAFGCSDDTDVSKNPGGGGGVAGTSAASTIAGSSGHVTTGGTASTNGSLAAGTAGKAIDSTAGSAGDSAGESSAAGSSADAGSPGAAGSSNQAGDGGMAGMAASNGGAANAGAATLLAGSNAGGAASPSVAGAAGTPGAAGAAGAAASTCDYGSVANLATSQTLNLFGDTVYFADGATLPSGRYRVTYQDGCMKYSSTQGWTVHAYANGMTAAWWLVGATSADRVAVPPGTVGYYATNGAFTTFDECVAANRLLAPTEFDFAGGKLGVYLLDSNYPDNVAGDAGRNPKWQLSLLSPCDTQAGAAGAAGAGN